MEEVFPFPKSQSYEYSAPESELFSILNVKGTVQPKPNGVKETFGEGKMVI